MKKARKSRLAHDRIGRGDRIRTCDFYLPKVALYQAELHPDGPRMITAQPFGRNRNAQSAMAPF